MKFLIVLITFVMAFANQAASQKYFTKTALVSFESKTPLENIDATNKSGTCVVDFTTGSTEFAVLVKGFQFEKALMQEHFNENYMESSKFPKASYKGKLEGLGSIDLNKNGKHKLKTIGQMTIHGVTKPHTADVVIEIKDGKILTNSAFSITVADYGIKIPALVRDNIAKVVNVKVSASLDPLK